MLGKSPDDDPNAIVQKKVLVMTLGNAKDIDALIDLLYSEENEEIKCHIITVLGALGRIEVISDLETIKQNETRINVKNSIEEAIQVIEGLSEYI